MAKQHWALNTNRLFTLKTATIQFPPKLLHGPKVPETELVERQEDELKSQQTSELPLTVLSGTRPATREGWTEVGKKHFFPCRGSFTVKLQGCRGLGDTEVVFTVPWGGENFSQVILSFGCRAEFNQLSLYKCRDIWFAYRYSMILNIGTGLQQQGKQQAGVPRAPEEYKERLRSPVCWELSHRNELEDSSDYSVQRARRSAAFPAPSLRAARPPPDASSCADVRECGVNAVPKCWHSSCCLPQELWTSHLMNSQVLFLRRTRAQFHTCGTIIIKSITHRLHCSSMNNMFYFREQLCTLWWELLTFGTG